MKIIGLFVLLISAGIAHSQYFYFEYSGDTPGGLNQDEAFPDGQGMSAGWNQILGPSEVSPVWSSNQSLPFTFNFDGSDYTTFKVSSTGVLTFTTGAVAVPDQNNAALPDANIPDNSICVWGLMADGGNDNVSTKTFGTAPNRQHWIHFSSCTNGTNTWSYWSIVLEETSNDICLVDQRHSTTGTGSLTAGIQINGTSAVQVTGSPNLANMAGDDATSADDHYYRFIQGNQSADEISLISFDMDQYTLQGGVDITGTVENLGSNAITSFDVIWNDGLGDQTYTVTGVNIPSQGTYDFTHGTQANMTAGTDYTIDVSVAMTGDVITSNNSLQGSTHALSLIPTKYVVGEEKTGTWCQWCPRGAVGLATMESEPRFIGIAVHDGDPMEVASYNGSIGTYVPGGYPRGGVDRVTDGNPINFDLMFAEIESTVAPCEVLWQNMVYNESSQMIEIECEVAFYGNIDGNYRLSAVVTENNVIGDGTNNWNQVNAYDGQGAGAMTDPVSGFEWGTAGSPVNPNDFGGYDHVAVALSDDDILGDAGSLPAGTVPMGNYTHKFADIPVSVLEDYGEAHVVIMIVNSSTGEIVNALSGGWHYVGLEENELDHEFMLYPNPSSGDVNMVFNLTEAEMVNISVVNMLGEVVMNTGDTQRSAGEHKLMINGDDFSNGVYFVNMSIGDQIVTKKLIMSK